MKILLLGEYSNVHNTLAKGLRALGHEATVASDGDGWKNYPRDVDLSRHSTSRWHALCYLLRVKHLMKRLKGYDVVQLINPVFLELKAERVLPYYYQLKKQNKSIFLGAFGMDYYWVKAGLDCSTFAYSDFNIGHQIRKSDDNERFIAEWLNGPKGQLNKTIAHDCNGIITGLYEYHMAYSRHFDIPQKLQFIPFPVETSHSIEPPPVHNPIRIFIGIQSKRNAYKGTDIMLKALKRIANNYPSEVEMVVAKDVPFNKYCHLMEDCDILLDQLYSYTPAMNGLLAMSKGLVLVGGGEEAHYQLLKEKGLRPIVNVYPTEECVYSALQSLIESPQKLFALKTQSIAYVKKHHNPTYVAQQYVDFWQRMQNKFHLTT